MVLRGNTGKESTLPCCTGGPLSIPAMGKRKNAKNKVFNSCSLPKVVGNGATHYNPRHLVSP